MTALPFHLFAGNVGLPGGGMCDYRGAFATDADARAEFARLNAHDTVTAGFGQIAEVRGGRLMRVAAWDGRWLELEDR